MTLLSIWCCWTCFPFWHSRLLLLKWHHCILDLSIPFLVSSLPHFLLTLRKKLFFTSIFSLILPLFFLSFNSFGMNYLLLVFLNTGYILKSPGERLKDTLVQVSSPRDTDLFRLEWGLDFSRFLFYFDVILRYGHRQDPHPFDASRSSSPVFMYLLRYMKYFPVRHLHLTVP